VIAAPPPLYPWPIGAGARYHPAALTATVDRSRPVAGMTCGDEGASFRVHLELFAGRRVVIVPAGIGISRRGCVYPVRTHAPTGVVEVMRGTRRTLGDLFAVWGRRLGRDGFLSFGGRVSAFVGGHRRSGDPRRIVLTPHEQIVLEVGGYVAPHATYLFPKGGR
jgi:hypothetical protein